MAPLDRRTLLRASAAATLGAAGAGALGGCAGLTSRVSSTSRGSRDRLTVQVYGTETETAFYDRLARRFEEQRRGITVEVTAVPFSEASTGIDSGLVSGTAPDVFRVDYPTMGVYAATGQLLDLTPALDELATDVLPAFMQAVTQGDRFYGVPQHVDTSAIVYRPDLLREAGITAVPDRPEDAWTWEELGEVADRLRDATPDDTSAFAVNWQSLGAFRWLNFLFQAGGHLYDEERTRAAIGDPDSVDGRAGIRALEFTQGFFERGWVPASTSTKSATFPDALFTAGTLSMLFAGNFLLPAFAETIGDRFEYAATFLPRDERRAAEIGGNALVATERATNPELAAEFLVFMAEAPQMADFCAAATLLPTRASLVGQRLDFAAGADLMPVYVDQITTIEQRDVADVTTPTFTEVLGDLADELEECFLGGRSPEETLRVLAERIDESAGLNAAGTTDTGSRR